MLRLLKVMDYFIEFGTNIIQYITLTIFVASTIIQRAIIIEYPMLI